MRRQQLAVGQVAGGAEDDQRRRVDREALEPLDQRVLLGPGTVAVTSEQALDALASARRSASAGSPSRRTRSAGQAVVAQRLQVAGRLRVLERAEL